MPTFFNSTADAAEAFESLRGLAHASRTFDQPAQMYGVVGDLSSGMRSPRQVLEQLVGVHEQKVAHTFNESGDHIAGVRDAMANGGTSRKVSIGYLNVTKRDGFGRETRIVGPDPERATLVKWAVRACATGALDYPADAVQPVLHGQHLLAGRDPRRHPRTASSPPKSGSEFSRCSPRTGPPGGRPRLTTTTSSAACTAAGVGRLHMTARHER